MRPAVFVLVAAGWLHPALAERGALTPEFGLGAALLRAPAAFGEAGAVDAALSPTLRLGLRYALTHAWEVGLCGAYSLPMDVAHDGVVIDGREGRLVYGLGAGTLATEARWLPFGLVYRPFLAARVGLHQQQWIHPRHLLVEPDGTTLDFGLGLADQSVVAALAGLSAGMEWVGDRLAAGLKIDVDVGLGRELLLRAGVTGYVAWSFFP